MNRSTLSSQLAALCRNADALLGNGRYDDAARAYRKVLSLDSTRADVWYNLGYALKAAGRFEEALTAYGRALQAGVADPQEVHLNRAAIHSNHLNRHDLAERELLAALALRPDYRPALLNLGNLHEERGDRAAALACYEKILRPGAATGSDPYRLEALARTAHLTPPQRPDAPLLKELRAAAVAAREPLVRANLWFALGQACERLGCTDQAFDAFSRGNASCRQSGPAYDPQRQERLVQALIGQFASPVPIRPADAGPQPLFICGMFRSGSTLLEQVLAAHPAVRAGGELDLLPRMVSGPLSPFPASMTAVTERQLEELSRGYLQQLRHVVPGDGECTYVTDKRPDNFLLIGLIKRLFPGAKFLHTVRHPLDNGLSVFMQHLDPRVAPYATDLRNTGHYYLQYRRVMAHWKALYPESIHDVDYDAFVRAPREALEPALAFLGLEWDPGCLNFHQRASTVRTASYWQVRRPLYREASGRWERYREHIRPLREALQVPERAGQGPG